jgi:hypothetical protein
VIRQPRDQHAGDDHAAPARPDASPEPGAGHPHPVSRAALQGHVIRRHRVCPTSAVPTISDFAAETARRSTLLGHEHAAVEPAHALRQIRILLVDDRDLR